jgi:hypothetical protein
MAASGPLLTLAPLLGDGDVQGLPAVDRIGT